MTAVSLCSPALDLTFRTQDLGRLMPMFVSVDPNGKIRDCGPTLARISEQSPRDRPLGDVFEMHHPRGFSHLGQVSREPLRMTLRGTSPISMKGVAVPLVREGVLLNLTFSGDLREAVRRHNLSDSDFAPTELAFDLLYLSEANAAVIAEARKFSARLRDARALALEQALSDPLTGLHNRRGLERALDRLERAGEPFGLIHLDLDHFKQINDTLGHAAGDRVLSVVAARLRTAIRDCDLAARIGGDEFVVLLAGLNDPAQAAEISQRILDTLARPVPANRETDPGGPSIMISASLGVAMRDGKSLAGGAQLLQMADRALYRSKHAGRGRVTFDKTW